MLTSSEFDRTNGNAVLDQVAVEARDLSKSYLLGELHSIKHTMSVLLRRSGAEAQERGFEALHAATFDARRGEVLAFLGSNGSGKSTALQIIAGITPPSAGSVRVHGTVLPLFEIGASFHVELTGRENVVLFGTILGLDREEILGAMDDIAAFAEVERHMDTPVKRYSLGMQARLSFATALRFPADVYIFDEVLAVVDDRFMSKCLDEMRGLADAGRCVLFVSHNLDVVRRVSDRALWLDQGALVAEGPVDEIADRYAAFQARPDSEPGGNPR